MSVNDKSSEGYEVTVNSTGSKLVVRASTIQKLHDQLNALTDAATFSVIGRLVATIGEDVEAQGNLGRILDAQPVDPPSGVANPPVEPKAETPPSNELPPPPAPPTSNPWNDDTAPKDDGPNLPSTTPPPTPPAPSGGLPPMPKWAQ